ncbi:MAG: DNA polymerase, partial [SAR202 cluster bacterium]|nr:DNA polymerase [SAR202 cluster bacterium]
MSVQWGSSVAGCQSGREGGSVVSDNERGPASVLYGSDPTPGLTAVEVSEGEAILIRAAGSDGKDRTQERRPFLPWLLLSEHVAPNTSDEMPPGARWTRLEGTGLAWLVEFRSWSEFLSTRERLRSAGIPQHAYSSPVKQFLVRSGVTLFRELGFQSVRRLQFDLETTGLRWDEPSSRILLIVASDNRGGEWVFSGGSEAALLEQFVALVREVDPDVLEGHNVFGFDLPWLDARARACRLSLALGRDGSPVAFGRERSAAMGGTVRPFRPAYVWGRHVLDTFLGVARFDVGRGELESYGLKEAAQHYGIASAERVYLDRSRLAELWVSDPERVRRYALQDVEETRRLAELVFPAEFYQTQMAPDSYQSVATGGTGEKINALLIREYLRQGRAVPLPQPPVACPGGYTEIRQVGVVHRVVKADVESLYPSIMLHYGIQPAADHLGVFLPMLRELTTRRIQA